MRCGVPLPSGVDLDPDRFSLTDSEGRLIPGKIQPFCGGKQGGSSMVGSRVSCFAGLTAWKQTVREETLNDVLNCFWNTPALVYDLRNFGRE